MRIVAVEEHWTLPGIDEALRALPAGAADESLRLNDRADIPERLEDLDELRIAAMDAAGIDLQVVSLAPPGTGGLPPAQAVALSREANDRAAAAVRRHPDRLRAMATLPLSDPAAAVEELRRTAAIPEHAGVMVYGRAGDRPLDDPAFGDLLSAAAELRTPVFLHPQIPTHAVRDASYRGFAPDVELGLATFGWGWHLEAGLAGLRLMLSGAFDRHPDLQLVLGHWGELLLFAHDRVDALSNVATHLERRIGDYLRSNVHVATSGMLAPHLMAHALAVTTADRVLFSGDYPFHRLDAAAVDGFLAAVPDPADRARIASGNAEALYGLA